MSDNESNNNNVEMKREYAVDEYEQQYVLFPEEVNFDNVVIVNAAAKTYGKDKDGKYNGADLLYKYPKYDDDSELVNDEFVYDYLRVYMPDNEDSKGNPKGLFSNKGVKMMGEGDSKKPTMGLFLTNRNKDTQKTEESEDQKLFNDFLDTLDEVALNKSIKTGVIKKNKCKDIVRMIYRPEDDDGNVSDNKLMYINIGFMKKYTNDKDEVRPAEVTAFIRDEPKYKKMYNKRVKELGKDLQGKERNEELAKITDEVSQECKLTVKNMGNYIGKRFALKKGIIRFYGIYQGGKKFSVLKSLTQGAIDYIELNGSQNKFQRKRKRTGKFSGKMIVQNTESKEDVKEDKGEEVDFL